jgi:hypothetical protein
LRLAKIQMGHPEHSAAGFLCNVWAYSAQTDCAPATASNQDVAVKPANTSSSTCYLTSRCGEHNRRSCDLLLGPVSWGHVCPIAAIQC